MIYPDSFLEGLQPYRVSLEEEPGDRFTLMFDCFAEDSDHAAEQALDAHPNGVVRNCTLFDFRDTTR